MIDVSSSSEKWLLSGASIIPTNTNWLTDAEMCVNEEQVKSSLSIQIALRMRPSMKGWLVCVVAFLNTYRTSQYQYSFNLNKQPFRYEDLSRSLAQFFDDFLYGSDGTWIRLPSCEHLSTSHQLFRFFLELYLPLGSDGIECRTPHLFTSMIRTIPNYSI